MVLGFKTKFDNGKNTNFIEKIKACVDTNYAQSCIKPKKHSIRKGKRWRVGHLIHMATGVRTKKYCQFNLAVVEGLQNIEIRHFTIYPGVVFVDGKRMSDTEIEMLAINDGFDSTADFWAYFTDDVFKGQIIHWTPLKY